MAGATNIGEVSDNPISVNVIPMVDVIFCLCLFFMCSFHFKQIEGKIDTWLPGHGQPGPPPPVILEEIRILLRWDSAAQAVVRRVGNRAPAGNDVGLLADVRDSAADYRRAGRTEFPVVLDATDAVPWQDVVHVMDLCKREGLGRIEFTAPYEPAPPEAARGNP